MRNKKLIYIFICFLIFSLIILFFYYKNLKTVNNISKSNTDLKNYILSISSYEATISVEVNSNKNTNKYIIKQWYASPNLFKQEIQAPENIQGLKTIYDGTNLKIENSRLNLSKIYQNYNYITNNNLCLNVFLKECKNNEITQIENENEITIGLETNKKYSKYKELTVDKKTKLPLKMKIMDENKKTLVYILYNEITINKTAKEDII